MSQSTSTAQDLANQVYHHAADLLFNKGKKAEKVIQELIDMGLDMHSANTVVHNLQLQYQKSQRNRAIPDILWGILWCGGGIFLTAAAPGYIFYGAIIYGGIRFFKGLFNLGS